VAGQRVQNIKKDPVHGGTLGFGTELVTALDGSIVAMLGASPGASTAVWIMLQVIERCFRQEAKFSTWLIQISINEAKMKLRKDRRHLYESMEAGQQNDEGDYIPKDFADWRKISSEALEQKELRKALTHALNSLPEKYRTVLILRDVQHLSITETAQVLGLSESNVKTRLCRARLQMRDALAPGFDGAWRR
jgi:RNA polymerase sigma factor (sigma-70 family)